MLGRNLAGTGAVAAWAAFFVSSMGATEANDTIPDPGCATREEDRGFQPPGLADEEYRVGHASFDEGGLVCRVQGIGAEKRPFILAAAAIFGEPAKGVAEGVALQLRAHQHLEPRPFRDRAQGGVGEVIDMIGAVVVAPVSRIVEQRQQRLVGVRHFEHDAVDARELID